jgi:hypothetical protein
MTLSTGLVETGIALPPTYHCWFLVFFPLCRRHLTRDYLDNRPDNLPEHSAVNVKISPLVCGFIRRCRRIIPQPGMLWLKR